MKKSILTIVLIVSSQLFYAQQKWSVGLSFMPGKSNLAYNELSLNELGNEFYKVKDWSSAINGSVRYKISQRFQISTGIGYKALAFKVEQKRMDKDSDLLALFGISNWLNSVHTSNYYFFYIPLNIEYNITNFNRLGIYLKTGISINYLYNKNLKSSSYFENDQMRIAGYYYHDKKFMYSLNIGAGFSYKLNQKFSIQFEPAISGQFI